jgi:hypothetical protein
LRIQASGFRLQTSSSRRTARSVPGRSSWECLARAVLAAAPATHFAAPTSPRHCRHGPRGLLFDNSTRAAERAPRGYLGREQAIQRWRCLLRQGVPGLRQPLNPVDGSLHPGPSRTRQQRARAGSLTAASKAGPWGGAPTETASWPRPPVGIDTGSPQHLARADGCHARCKLQTSSVLSNNPAAKESAVWRFV